MALHSQTAEKCLQESKTSPEDEAHWWTSITLKNQLLFVHYAQVCQFYSTEIALFLAYILLITVLDSLNEKGTVKKPRR